MNKSGEAWVFLKMKCHDLGRPFLTFYEIELTLERNNIRFERLDQALELMRRNNMLDWRDEDIKIGCRLRCYYIK